MASPAALSQPHPRAQSQYQVRFDWGVAGVESVATDADVTVWVDVLASADAAPPAVTGVVVAGDLRNRTAVAEWVLARQAEKGDRSAVAVIAAGARFDVEDFLAAGAIIDALAEVGIDYCSPEAAAAAAAFTSLRGAIGHLVSASVSGRELAASGRSSEVELAVQLDASSEVTLVDAPLTR